MNRSTSAAALWLAVPAGANTDGGEAWQAARHAGGISSFAISPDGRTRLFTALDPRSADERRRRRERDDAVVVDVDGTSIERGTFHSIGEK